AKDGTTIVLPFSREAMAVYLGTNQSALSRELSRMQEEGIIRFQGNRFEIL
ncbi:MAG: winged helix-turn-helix domain-containing protein, partial [Erysipelotrichaceae bacterium]|nr:winged helix-turn-helix domain-containing protein [Erysipelotrichaceae bacterium]